MKSFSSNLALFSLSLFTSQAIASCGYVTSLLRRNVIIKRDSEGLTGRAVAVSNFGYLGENGPANWASLSSANAFCANGTHQSPIDITDAIKTILPAGSLIVTITDIEEAEFENLRSTVEVVMEDKGGVTVINDKEYDLKQFHFHSPGEHNIDGENFPLEMHMVHQATAIAVLAFHFQLSSINTTFLLTSLLPTLTDITKPGSIASAGPLSFSSLIETFNSVPVLSPHHYVPKDRYSISRARV